MLLLSYQKIKSNEGEERKKLENLVSLVVIKWWEMSHIFPRLHISEVSFFFSPNSLSHLFKGLEISKEIGRGKKWLLKT